MKSTDGSGSVTEVEEGKRGKDLLLFGVGVLPLSLRSSSKKRIRVIPLKRCSVVVESSNSETEGVESLLWLGIIGGEISSSSTKETRRGRRGPGSGLVDKISCNEERFSARTELRVCLRIGLGWPLVGVCDPDGVRRSS